MTTLDEDTANDVVRAYVWKNGIDQKPTPFIYSDVKGGMYANAPYGVNGVKTIEMFNTVRVHGDLTKDAVIATSSWKNLRPVFQFVKDGALHLPGSYAQWPVFCYIRGRTVQVLLKNVCGKSGSNSWSEFYG